jgi:2-dehydro-3-deoxy-D-gluconate 5-dehydrogenase
MNEWLTRSFGLDGKVALVTGARTGIGRACALAMAHAGADLVLWGRKPHDTDEVAEEITQVGRSVQSVSADVGDVDATAAVADRLLDGTRVDILVNNAGTIHRQPAHETSLAAWRHVVATNLDAPFLLCQRFGAAMLQRGEGSIVNIASLLSFQGGLTVPAYAASKHGIAGLTKALANEWAPRGVNVNAVAPGYVSTNNTEALRHDPDREPAIRARIPVGTWATPADIAGAVVFLASPAAAYVHGHVLVVDGGWMGR